MFFSLNTFFMAGLASAATIYLRENSAEVAGNKTMMQCLNSLPEFVTAIVDYEPDLMGTVLTVNTNLRDDNYYPVDLEGLSEIFEKCMNNDRNQFGVARVSDVDRYYRSNDDGPEVDKHYVLLGVEKPSVQPLWSDDDYEDYGYQSSGYDYDQHEEYEYKSGSQVVWSSTSSTGNVYSRGIYMAPAWTSSIHEST